MRSWSLSTLSRSSEEMVGRMRRFKPDVVITFGGDGGQNTHPDHMMASMVTTAAFHWSPTAETISGCGRSV